MSSASPVRKRDLVKNKIKGVLGGSGSSSLFTLSETNNVDGLLSQIRKEPDFLHKTNKTGETVLHIASRLGYFEQVEQLLNAGASANVRDAQGWIPLHSCCANFTPNTLAICKSLLITGKTQAEVPTNSGTTPLHYLSRCTVTQEQFGLLNEVIDLMLLHGNYIDSQTKFGETPLHQASLHGNLETIRLLIEKGAKCNARTKEGETALHIATRANHFEAVKLLITHGADPNAVSESGNCFDYCQRYSLPIILNYLNDRKAQLENNNNANDNDDNNNANDNEQIVEKKEKSFVIDPELVSKIEKMGFESAKIISTLYQLYKKNLPIDDEKILLSELSNTSLVNTECKVCLDNSVNCVLLPCRHSCLCVDCAELVKNSGCPVCREPINQVIPIFLS